MDAQILFSVTINLQTRMNLWKVTAATIDESKMITSVIIALNPKEATEVFKNSVVVPLDKIGVKQLGVAASNFRTVEVVLTSVQ